MRREGFELAVSRPQVIYKQEDGQTLEPAEYLVVDIESQYQGAAIENLGRRGLEIKNMAPEGTDRIRIEGIITARGLIGFKSEFLTTTKGTGLMHHSFHGFVPKKGAPAKRLVGALVAQEGGTSTSYALEALQERSVLFVPPQMEVYKGQIVGQNARDTDMLVNPCKKKALTNMRAAGTDDVAQLTPHKAFTLEQAIEFIEDDELVEITPSSVRLRKKQLNYSVKKRHATSGN
jgi:GTP-binding protein